MPSKIHSIGLLGGSFNPPHNGHLALAQLALEELQLDQLQFIPCYQHPFGKQLVHSEHRLKMLQLLLEEQPKLHLNSIEIKRQNCSDTLTTLQQIRQQDTSSSIIFIMGNDVLASLNQWHNWQQLFEYCHLAIVKRAGYQIKKAAPWLQQLLNKRQQQDPSWLQQHKAGAIYFLKNAPDSIAATSLRTQLSAGHRPAIEQLPDKLTDYIRQHNIYA